MIAAVDGVGGRRSKSAASSADLAWPTRSRFVSGQQIFLDLGGARFG